MKKLVAFLLFLLFSIWIGLLIHADPGYAYFSYKTLSIEMPFWVSLFLILLFAIAFTCSLRLLKNIRFFGKNLKTWQKKRRRYKANIKTNMGLIELNEGYWVKAEKLLKNAAINCSMPLIAYLACARAAQEQHAAERRDEYLRLADLSTPKAKTAVALTQAELQLNENQLEQALATLKHLQQKNPKHAYTLKLLKRVYLELCDWENLQNILPELQKAHVMKNRHFIELERTVYLHRLTQMSQVSLEAIQQLWCAIPKALQKDINIIYPYAKTLHHFNADVIAEELLRPALKREWHDDAIKLYGKLKGKNSEQQLNIAEGWIKAYGNNPLLLLTLGRLCIQNSLWGKARSYFRASLDIQALAETYFELGQLLEQLEETSSAMNCYRQGLALDAN